MITQFFLGVRESYNDEAQPSANAFLKAINRALSQNRIEPYSDRTVPVSSHKGQLLGRSSRDRHPSRVFAELAGIAETSRKCPNLALIRDNPHRVTFVPRPLKKPLATGYSEKMRGKDVEIRIGSLTQLAEELLSLARVLRIPIVNGTVTDEVAESINMLTPIHERDSKKLIEEYRTAWLALHEGARMAIDNGVALTLAD